MNSDHSPMNVFVSATIGDLESVRAIVERELQAIGWQVVEQGSLGTEYRAAVATLEEQIGRCEVFVQIVGKRFGKEPDLETRPWGAPRRSYVQLEAEVAHRLEKKLFFFLAEEGFAYDACAPEAEDKTELQQAYRERILQGDASCTRVADAEDVAQLVPQLPAALEVMAPPAPPPRPTPSPVQSSPSLVRASPLPAQSSPSRERSSLSPEWSSPSPPQWSSPPPPSPPPPLPRSSPPPPPVPALAPAPPPSSIRFWHVAVAVCGFIIIMLAIGRGLGWVVYDAFPSIVPTIATANRRGHIKANLQRRIHERGEQIIAEHGRGEIVKGIPAVQIQQTQQLEDIDHFLDWLESVAANDENSAEFILAVDLLEQKGPLQAREFLESKNDERARHMAIYGTTNAPEIQRGRRMLNQERMFIAALLEKDLRFDEAAAQYRALIAADPQWKEPGTRLQDLLARKSATVADSDKAIDLLNDAINANSNLSPSLPTNPGVLPTPSTPLDAGAQFYAQARAAKKADAAALYAKSAAAYREALKALTPTQQPQDWARAQRGLGAALHHQALRSPATAAVRLLEEAAVADREALKVRSRQDGPRDWAETQRDLGEALLLQTRFSTGAGARPLLDESSQALRSALEVYTREQSPQDWAATQQDLAEVLTGYGRLDPGAGGAKMLAAAAEAAREVLKVYTREKYPMQWASAQEDLSYALGMLSEHTEGADTRASVEEVAAIYRQLLTYYTPESRPLEWARAQDYLGRALGTEGEQTAGADALPLYDQAAAAFQQALRIYTRAGYPQDWARLQSELGLTLFNKSERVTGELRRGLLGEAVATFRLALEELAPEKVPYHWAKTEGGLGHVLRLQATGADQSSALALLEEAATCDRAAVKYFTQSRFPRQWSETQQELSLALKATAQRTTGEAGLKLAAEAATIDQQLETANTAGAP